MTWIWSLLAVLASFCSLAGAIYTWYLSYDLRFTVQSHDRSITSIWSKINSVQKKITDEARAEMAAFLEEAEHHAPQQSGPDIGQMLLMQMMGQGMGGMGGMGDGPTAEDERMQAIDDIILGSGGDEDGTE